jgi:hypothetical protein
VNCVAGLVSSCNITGSVIAAAVDTLCTDPVGAENNAQVMFLLGCIPAINVLYNVVACGIVLPASLLNSGLQALYCGTSVGTASNCNGGTIQLGAPCTASGQCCLPNGTQGEIACTSVGQACVPVQNGNIPPQGDCTAYCHGGQPGPGPFVVQTDQVSCLDNIVCSDDGEGSGGSSICGTGHSYGCSWVGYPYICDSSNLGATCNKADGTGTGTCQQPTGQEYGCL